KPARTRLPFAAIGRTRTVKWLLLLVMLCQLSPALSESQADQPPQTAPLKGGVRKIAPVTEDPGLRIERPVTDSSSPAQYPLHAEQFAGSAVGAAPPGLGSGVNTTALPPFPLHANRFGSYAAQFPPPGLRPQSATIDSSSQPPFPLRADRFSGYALDSNQIQSLAKYDLEIIIDRSVSMRHRDCPGGLSRWEWCGYQAQDIAKALNPFVANGMTISRFAGDFDVHERSSLQEVAA